MTHPAERFARKSSTGIIARAICPTPKPAEGENRQPNARNASATNEASNERGNLQAIGEANAPHNDHRTADLTGQRKTRHANETGHAPSATADITSGEESHKAEPAPEAENTDGTEGLRPPPPPPPPGNPTTGHTPPATRTHSHTAPDNRPATRTPTHTHAHNAPRRDATPTRPRTRGGSPRHTARTRPPHDTPGNPARARTENAQRPDTRARATARRTPNTRARARTDTPTAPHSARTPTARRRAADRRRTAKRCPRRTRRTPASTPRTRRDATQEPPTQERTRARHADTTAEPPTRRPEPEDTATTPQEPETNTNTTNTTKRTNSRRNRRRGDNDTARGAHERQPPTRPVLRPPFRGWGGYNFFYRFANGCRDEPSASRVVVRGYAL